MKFEIYHLDLGSQTEDACDNSNDVLMFRELTDKAQSVHCARNYSTEYASSTNRMNVTFTTNAEHDAQGFRIFYHTGIDAALCENTCLRMKAKLSSRMYIV